MQTPRVVVWFSCGAASAVAAQQALKIYGADHEVVVVYCDTSKNEHSDNARFMADVERWLGVKIITIKSPKYSRVEQVFRARQYMSGIHGAPCTVELKKIPRFIFQQADDLNIFGFTADKKEFKRRKDFTTNNPEMALAWVLQDAGITKRKCFQILLGAGIELPMMYQLGYQNNNCIGCVKATSPAYWAKIKKDFPREFAARAKQSRKIGCKLTRINDVRIYLDELPEGNYGRYKAEDISCGPECGTK